MKSQVYINKVLIENLCWKEDRNLSYVQLTLLFKTAHIQHKINYEHNSASTLSTKLRQIPNHETNIYDYNHIELETYTHNNDTTSISYIY